jgi:hypothetical protein
MDPAGSRLTALLASMIAGCSQARAWESGIVAAENNSYYVHPTLVRVCCGQS